MSDELTPPPLDDSLVARLASLAARIDGSPPLPQEEWMQHVRDPDLDEFNRLSGLKLDWRAFQGVYGAEEHDVWVRRLLIADRTPARPAPTRDQLIALFRRAVDDRGIVRDEDALTYLDATISKSLGVDGATDLIYWPNEWYGDDDLERQSSPEAMADAVLARAAPRTTPSPEAG